MKVAEFLKFMEPVGGDAWYPKAGVIGAAYCEDWITEGSIL